MNKYDPFQVKKTIKENIAINIGYIPHPKLIGKEMNKMFGLFDHEEILIILMILLLLGEDTPDLIMVGLLLFLLF